MEIIKILYANLSQKKIEKEYMLEKLLNQPSPTQIEDCLSVLEEIGRLNLSTVTLENYIIKPNNDEQ